MSVVAIIGAGDIGGATARALASRGHIGVVRLIDQNEAVAAGKALDLTQSGPMSRSDTRIEAAGDFSAASGARAIVFADPAGADTDWSAEVGLSVLRQLTRLGYLDRSTLIFAGATHRPLIQRGIDELGLSRRRAIGSAPESLAATARALVAIEAGAASSQVALTVLGRPPERFVIPWNDASVGGHGISSLLTAPQMQHIDRRLRGLWPPGPNSLAAAAAVFCQAAVQGSRRILSAFVSLDRDNGTKAPVCAWPVSLGPDGIERITTPDLTNRDRIVIDEVLQ
jgi:malate dehydrogenase